MKQTKSALTMLLAHYRAIYKHAILAAFVAASTLGAGSAMAAASLEDKFPTEAEGVITIDKNTVPDATAGKTAGEVEFKTANTYNTGSATKLIIGDTGHLKVTGSVGNIVSLDITTDDFTINGTDGGRVTEGKLTIEGTADEAGTVNVTSKNVGINGKIDVKANGVLNFKGGTTGEQKVLTTGTGSNISNAGILSFENYNADLSNATLTQVNTGAIAVGGNSTVTLKDEDLSSAKFKGKLSINNGTLIVKTSNTALDLTSLGFDDAVGKIKVEGDNSKLYADKISIDGKALKEKTTANLLAVETKDLTILTHATENEQKATSVKSLTVSEKVTVQAATVGGTPGAVIAENLQLNTGSAEGTGSITLNKNSLDVSQIDLKGKLIVEQGSWTADTTLDTQASSELTVNKDTTLTLKGLTVTDGTTTIEGKLDAESISIANNKEITLKGATSSLDISKVTFTGTGAIALTDKVEDVSKLDLKNKNANFKVNDNATLKLTGTQLGDEKQVKSVIAKGAKDKNNSLVQIIKADGTLDNVTLAENRFANDKIKVDTDATLEGANLTVTDDISTGSADGTVTVANQAGTLKFDSATFEANKNTGTISSSITGGTLSIKDSLSITNKDTTASAPKSGAFTVTNSTLDLRAGGKGELNVTNLVVNAGTVNVDGAWKFTGKDAGLKFDTGAAGSLNLAKNASLVSTGTLDTTVAGTIEMDSNASATFNKLATTEALTIDGGKLTITGNGTEAKGYLTIGTAGVNVKGDGSFVIQNGALGELIKVDKGVATVNAMAGKISTIGNSEVVLDYQAGTKISADLLKKINTAFKNGNNTFTGFINLGQAELSDKLNVENNHFNWADYKDLANAKITNNVIKNAIADTTKADATKGINGSIGAINVTEALDKTNTVTIAGSTVLSNAKANNNNFVSAKDAKTSVGVNVADKSTLSLHNGGKIGSITLGATESNLIIKDGDTVVDGKIEGTGANISAKVKFLGTKTTIKDSVNIEAFKAEKSNVNAKTITLNINVANTDLTTSRVANSTVNVEKLEFKASATSGITSANKNVLEVKDNGTLIVDGAFEPDASGHLVNAGQLILANDTDGVIDIGHKQDTKNIADKEVSSNGVLFVRDSSKLNGTVKLESGVEQASVAIFANEMKQASLNPANKKEAKTLVMPLANGASPDIVMPPAQPSTPVDKDPTPYTLQHTDIVGANSAVAYGYNSIDEFMSDMKTNNLMTEKGGIKDGRAVAVVNTSTTLDSTVANTGNIVLGDASSIASSSNPDAGNVYLGDKSAIIVTDNAFGVKNDQTALTVAKDGVQIAKEADNKTNKDTKVILTGAFTSGDQRQVFNAGALKAGETLDLETATGMLVGKIGADGKVTLAFNDKFNSSAVFNKASTPVRDYLVGMGKGEVKDVITDKAAAKKDEMTQFTQGLTTALDGGQTLEQAARFAVYGGSIKAAELATKSGSDAIKSYASANANVATAQTDMGSFFVVPTYKTSDSDSFNAEGLDFGSDINLSGVALGADFVVAPAVKLGAMFNIGTGDAKGQGAAEGIESDLDYVGGGFFVNYNQDNINVVADITYTQSSADMTGNVTAQGKYNQMKAEADTKALSLGVQGEYKVDLDTSYAIPYAGVRITKYDMDGYTVQLDGNDFITNNFDSMTVLSVPVGVKLGTEIVSGDWSLAPSLDLGVTFNLGDTDLSHSAKAVSKVQGMTLSTEVIDDVVFGIKGGLKANYQSLSLGLGLGYEMGSNSDDLSVQGTVKYTF